jgi:hypothetical protein
MPLKIPAHMIGSWHHPQYGTIDMTQEKMDQLKRNFADNVIGRKVFVRIGHDKGSAPTFGDAPAEAVVQELVQEGQVLYALAEPNDENAAELIRSGRYRYTSPEYQENYQSKLDGSFKGATLEAIALTNEPFLPGLPENRLLADHPDGYILNFGEVKNSMEKIDQLLEEQKKQNGLLSKISDGIAKLFSIEKQEAKEEKGDGDKKDEPQPKDKPEPKPKLADEDPAQKQLADQVKALEQQLGATRQLQHAAEVDKKLAEYVQKGIPPAVIDQVKPILLADIDQAKIIKLSDDKTISASEQVFEMLDKFPDASRVKLSQVGSQTAPTVDEKAAEESKKLCDQVMTDLGAKMVDGKYVL